MTGSGPSDWARAPRDFWGACATAVELLPAGRANVGLADAERIDPGTAAATRTLPWPEPTFAAFSEAGFFPAASTCADVRIGTGSSSSTGSARMRATSAADSTRTGVSATTPRTAATAVSPIAAAPAATAAQAAKGSQVRDISLVCPHRTLFPR